jgi:UDP-N-acetylmuramyl tripeptide synthase
LFAGKGHEKYEIDALGKHPFDEAEIARAAYAEITGGR